MKDLYESWLLISIVICFTIYLIPLALSVISCYYEHIRRLKSGSVALGYRYIKKVWPEGMLLGNSIGCFDWLFSYYWVGAIFTVLIAGLLPIMIIHPILFIIPVTLIFLWFVPRFILDIFGNLKHDSGTGELNRIKNLEDKIDQLEKKTL